MKRKIFDRDDRAYAAIIGGLVAIFVVILLGSYLYFQITESMATGSTEGAAAMTTVNSTAQTVFTLAPIIGIIAVASIMISIVTRFGTGGI